MTYTPPAYTVFQWQDNPSKTTPLDKASLEAAEQSLADHTNATAVDLAGKVSDGTLLSPSVETSSSNGSAWTWNGDGTVASETLSNGTVRDTYTYNADGSIHTFRETIGGVSHVYQYAYDASGNPTGLTQVS